MSNIFTGPDKRIVEPLTDRELAVLRLTARGFTNKDIGVQLAISDRTVQGHSNPHGFDLEAWMLEHRINASGYVRETTAPQRLAARAHTPAAWIAATRAAVRQRILATLGDAPHAGVIVALVVGDEGSIPHDQWRAFTRTGVNHLLSISGLHVTMIAALAGWLVASIWRRLPRRAERLPARQAGLVAAVLAALGYALLAGFQVPAQRTLFMLMVLALAFWGRREARRQALCVKRKEGTSWPLEL